MKDSAELDEADLVLINALQVAPRAPWAVIAKAMDVSPVTAARRWQRLRSAGLAWITAYGGHFVHQDHCLAFVDVDCAPGEISRIAGRLAEHPGIASVEQASGRRDLLLTVMVSGLGALPRLHTDVLGPLPGVTAVRSHIVTRFFAEGAGWEIGAISGDQRDGIRGPASRPGGGPPPEPDAEDRALLLALGADGRMAYSDLADLTAMSESTVRRRVGRLLRAKVLVLRCEVAHSVSPYPVFVTYHATVQSDALERIGPALAALPEVRMCASVASEHNLVVNGWLRSIPDSHRLESFIARRFPEVTILGRSLTLANTKRMGWILDQAGRAVRHVPIDLWH
ncbi:Lrp/AsnC family transcriptional regulator [Actinomadura graeca]|uniref:Lrp/AsnC family transcriptional regulator n=1 Tax=Actinomadura graeca TaxID=2750812 RepID=A0ABX8QR77_9ACTN|nr:Lrp/AsnC family transcriptional regulator [Actinomadura graeca]QXJ21283.1 Lrp/AsnC family transcriptional regulator [Actinomadura graeca]